MSVTASDKFVSKLYAQGVIHYGTGAEKVLRQALDEYHDDLTAESVARYEAEGAEKLAAYPGRMAWPGAFRGPFPLMGGVDVDVTEAIQPGTIALVGLPAMAAAAYPKPKSGGIFDLRYTDAADIPVAEDTHADEIADAANDHGQGSVDEPEFEVAAEATQEQPAPATVAEIEPIASAEVKTEEFPLEALVEQSAAEPEPAPVVDEVTADTGDVPAETSQEEALVQ